MNGVERCTCVGVYVGVVQRGVESVVENEQLTDGQIDRHTHTHTHTCKMVMLMLVEVSPSPIATEPVVGRKSAPGTASWSAGSPEAIAVLKGQGEEGEGRRREKRGREKEKEGEEREGNCVRVLVSCISCLLS